MARGDIQLQLALTPVADIVESFDRIIVAADEARVAMLVNKYLVLLGFDGPAPRVSIVPPSVNRRWRGRCVWSPKAPESTRLEVDQVVTGDARTLERIVAHETIHHTVFLTSKPILIPGRRALFPDGAHGPRFRAGAAKINAKMGPDFVTVTCGEELGHVFAPLERDLFVLVKPVGKSFAWAWAAALSPKAECYCSKQIRFDGARLFRVRDRRFIGRAGTKIRHGFGLPRDPALVRELAALYHSGKEIDP